MKKAILILTRCPYPVNGGRESILSQTIDFLDGFYDLTILYFSKNKLDKNEFDKRSLNSYQLRFPSKIELLYNIAFRRYFSLQENLFYSRSNLGMVDKIIDKIQPELVYVDMIRTSQYIENYDIYKVIDIDDLLSIRYQRFISQKESSIFGTFSSVVPSFIRNVVGKILKNIILEYESKKIGNREIEIVEKYDSCFLVSEKEKDHLIMKTNSHNIYTNTQAIKPRENLYEKNVKCNNLLFIGNMLTAQNKSSLEMIVNEILPKFRFNYKFFVVGKYDDTIEELTYKNSNIELLGFVDNLEETLRSIKLALMPISFGTGIKTKVLDCMSYGIPVLTNTVGSEGLNTKDYKDIFILNNNEITNDSMLRILNDNELLESIGENGYQYIKNYHNFDVLRNSFLDHINAKDD